MRRAGTQAGTLLQEMLMPLREQEALLVQAEGEEQPEDPFPSLSLRQTQFVEGARPRPLVGEEAIEVGVN